MLSGSLNWVFHTFSINNHQEFFIVKTSRTSALLRALSPYICCLLFSIATHAQTFSGVENYAYSIFTGTGAYKIDDRTIYILRMPLRWQLLDPDYESKKIGLSLLAPAAIGITSFDDPFKDIPELRVDDLQTVSFVPGVEAQIPISNNWRLKPFAQAGMGLDLKSSNNSVVWGVGARTRAWFGENDRLLLGGEILFASDDPNSQAAETTFTRWALGTEYKLQTNWAPFGRRISWHFRLIEWRYTNPVQILPPIEETKINATTEFGVSFGLDQPLNLLGYKFTQGGISYKWSENLRAVMLTTKFPF